jgi:hypothetical protein
VPRVKGHGVRARNERGPLVNPLVPKRGGERKETEQKKMHCRWCWGCLAGLFMLQVVLLWWWLPAASVAPPSIAQPQPALSKECHAALTALETTKGELFYRVATARLMVADYARLRRDFLRLHSMSDEAIDAWLLDEVAFLSSNHFAHVRPPPSMYAVRPPKHWFDVGICVLHRSIKIHRQGEHRRDPARTGGRCTRPHSVR